MAERFGEAAIDSDWLRGRRSGAAPPELGASAQTTYTATGDPCRYGLPYLRT